MKKFNDNEDGFGNLSKILIWFILKYIADLLTPSSFPIPMNLLDSFNRLKTRPCLYATFNKLFFCDLMIVSYSLAIGTTLHNLLGCLPFYSFQFCIHHPYTNGLQISFFTSSLLVLFFCPLYFRCCVHITES